MRDLRDMESSNVPENKVPNSIAQVGITIRYAFLDYFRSRRFAILFVIMLIISGLLTFVVGYYRPPSFVSAGVLSFYSSWWGMSVTFVTVLTGIFFGGDAISGEFQNKTGYFTVPNPIRRSSIYVGKWISAFLAATIVFLSFTAITIANEAYYYGLSIPSQFGESFLFAWIYLIAVLGFTFFFSSLFKSTAYSILVTAILFLFAFNLVELLVSTFAQVEPWFMLTYGSSIIGNVLNGTYPAHEVVRRGFGGDLGGGANNPNAPTFTTFNATIPEGLTILAIYFIVTAILGLILFERKEFN